jgi:mRNA-degrading endonuclease RelE of RelBE toxin-antitoxin system
MHYECYTTESFHEAFAKLPKEIRARARTAYRKFKADPFQRGLHFKRVHTVEPVYSARVTDDYRVLGMMDGNEIAWFWIGKHEEYERLLKSL